MPSLHKTSVGVDAVQRLIRIGAARNALRLLEKQHPADLAEVLRALPDRDRLEAFDLLLGSNSALALEAMTELDPQIGASLLTDRSAEEIARLVQELPPDDAATIVGELPEELSARTLALMRQPSDVRALLEHEQQTAGRIMNPHVFALAEDETAGDAVAALQRGRGLEMVFYLYIVDARRHLVGVTSLRRLLLVPPETPLKQIMTSEVVSVHEDTDQEEVARLVASYNLLAVPVVDEENKLVGFVTVDDVIDVMKDETTEDIHKLGGLEALDEPYTRTPFWSLMKKRGRWLTVLFLGQLLTAAAIARFQDDITRAVVLTLFVPLIISSGGNSGSQAAALIIRAMAVGEVTLGDWWRVMRRELVAGLVLGLILAVLGFLRIGVWEQLFGVYGAHWALLGLTVALALVGVVLWGTVAGSMLPFIMRRVGADPATSSAPLVSTLVDVTGLIIYFSIAAMVLRGTLL